MAPGSFGTVPAVAAAQVIADAWRERSDDAVGALPLSDGGSGVLDVVRSACGGSLEALTVPDVRGRPAPAAILRCGTTAYVEAAHAVGIYPLAPVEAAGSGTSEGIGRLMGAAWTGRPARVVVGLGPSPCRDLGVGVLRGLGLTPAAHDGEAGPARVGPGAAEAVARLRDELRACDLVVACAEDRPVVGPHGLHDGRTTPVPDGLEHLLAELSRAVAAAPAGRVALPLAGPSASGGLWDAAGRAPRTGAGGGAALVLSALGGRLLDGVEVLAAAVGLDAATTAADLVVTGAARLDADELAHGVVGATAARGRALGVPVVAIVGSIDVSRRELAAGGVVGAYAVLPPPGPFRPPGGAGRGVDVESLRGLARRVATTWSPRR